MYHCIFDNYIELSISHRKAEDVSFRKDYKILISINSRAAISRRSISLFNAD